MGFRSQKRRSLRNTFAMQLGFGLMVPLVVLSVHVMLALPLWALKWLTGWDMTPTGFFWANTGAALLLIVGGWWLESSSLHQGGGIALARRLGARMADGTHNSRDKVYINVVQELCIAARMPVPAIMVIDRSDQINAMATGWQRRDQAIVLTDEALRQLQRDELQAVVAHELSHIREGDTFRNMQLASMVYGLQMVFGYGRSVASIQAVFSRIVGTLLMYAGLVGWLAGCLLQAAIARQREFLADAHAVEWTRHSHGLIGALEKIDAHNMPHAREHLMDLELMGSRIESAAAAHMWLAPSLEFQNRWMRLLDSHPPTQERLRRLQMPVQF